MGLFSLPAIEVPPLGDAVPRRGNRVTQVAAALLLRALGWRIEGDIPSLSKAVLVGAPHTTNWDFALTMATAYALGARLQWVGKRSLFRWPMGIFMRWAGGISVDRRVSAGLVQAMVEEFRRRETFLLAIMPQGTRRPGATWKTGFHYIARGAGVPIVLVAFDYGRKAVRFGPTLAPSGDVARDVAEIQSYFVDVRGKYANG